MRRVSNAQVANMNVPHHGPRCLYTDGGVVGKNPSPLAGTWAFIEVNRNSQITKVIQQRAGIMWADAWEVPAVSNNMTELAAVLNGLASLPSDWVGTVYSDSKITLGRVFLKWALKGIPESMVEDLESMPKRFDHWDKMGYVLLQGHPTRVELEVGMGHKGYPVSLYNVMCDRLCTEAAEFAMNNWLKGASDEA